MSKKHRIGTALTAAETRWGFVYLLVELFALPSLLFWANDGLDVPFTEAEVNILFYLINFLAMLVIFHDFLGKSAWQVAQHPMQLCEAVVLGLAAYYALTYCTMLLITQLDPGYANYNDASIAAMSRSSLFLMFIGTVVLVPPFEECMFRGLIFRNLYGKSPVIAYLVSIAAFAAIHILGYLGMYTPLEIAMACLQYLPAGLCLAWAYTRADTIFAPIVIHAVINYLSLRALR